MTDEASTYPRVRWHNSLIVRVIILCALLVLCLLGTVYVISQSYFTQVVEEMQAHTLEIARNVTVYYEENPDAPVDALERELGRVGANIEFLDGEEVPTLVTLEHAADGGVNKVARTTLPLPDGRRALLTVRVALAPQTEILRAFKNEYILLLTGGFLVTLGLMIYFIARTLRPLGELAERCARISRGRLERIAVRKNAGEILALEHTFNDMVTALREKELMEANLRQAQRLSALGSLAAGVAHDVRNPLNAIKLLSSHALDNLAGQPASERAIKQLETIRNEVDRLDEIVTGFLSLARERELDPKPNRVDGLLTESVQLIRQDAERRGIRLITELRAGDTTLMLDAKQWTRAILNVLINALEACPEGGRVRVFSRLTDVACEVEIRDDGPGLTPEVAERAFDPYFTTKSTGTGLGLSITRGIIEEHGGTISLSGRPDGGCQVLIVQPLRAAQP